MVAVNCNEVMGHELRPKAGQPHLVIGEITSRMQAAFKFVELDKERASQDLQGWIDWVQEARKKGATAYSDEQIEKARRAIGRSFFVILADDPNTETAYLSFSLEPEDKKIFIGYESDVQEQASDELRTRLARVLDYDMELV